MPKTTSSSPTARAPRAGQKKLRFRLSVEVRRQASNGPTAVNRSNANATGMVTRLKNGGPTVTLLPCTHSDKTGNSVPHRTVKHATRNSRLLKRKLDSRETSDSSLCSLRRCDLLRTKKKTQVAIVRARKVTNQFPMEDWANACTELTTPLRVRNVPKMQRKNVEKMSHMFQIFSMPRFSCIITECRNAVPINQGMKEAFSTGSQPQYPPQPKTE